MCVCVCVCIQISDCNCIRITVATQHHRSETFLHKSGAMWNVNQIFIIWAWAWQWLGEYVTLDRRFYSLVFKKEVVAAPFTATLSSLSAFLVEDFIRNTITILCINYILILCIRNNNAVINNYRRPQDLILVFSIPLGTRRNCFEICT
jgi:hypothetical protein